jgi:hypothetical protein
MDNYPSPEAEVGASLHVKIATRNSSSGSYQVRFAISCSEKVAGQPPVTA